MTKVVIFDLDDTMISEKQYIMSGYKHISALLSSEIEIEEAIILADLIQLLKKSPKNVFNRLYEKYNVQYSREMVINLVNEYRGHLPDIQFYDDVFPCLKELKKLGVKTGIITDGYAIAQRQKLKVIKADDYFDEIIVTDELGRDYWKPHPKAFELMREKFNVEFNEMFYIGDNPEKDFYIGEIYPIKTFRIRRPDTVYSSKSYYKWIEEDVEINTLGDIKEYI